MATDCPIPSRHSQASQSRLASAFVWAAWSVMLLAAFWFADRFGNRVPFVDEWRYIPILTDEEAITPEWLWQPHGEHRIPIAKFIWATFIKQTRSFKVGAYINVALLGIASLMLLRTAQTFDGGLTYSDAVIPVLLLHFGHGYNLQWWWQIMEILPSLVLCILLVAIIRVEPQFCGRWAFVAGACLMAIPFCGPSGLPSALAISVWTCVLGIRAIQKNRPATSFTGLAVTAMAFAAMILVGLYFVRLKKPDHMPPSPGLEATARTAAQFLSVSVGPGASEIWPKKSIAIALFVAVGCLLLVSAWFRRPAERFRIAGLTLLTAAIFPLALSLGWGRAYAGASAGLSHWYAIFGAPPLLSAYFAWRLYAPGLLGATVRGAMLAAICAMLAFNLIWSRRAFVPFHHQMVNFINDLNAGLPLPALCDRYSSIVASGDNAPIFLEPCFQKLKDAGFPVFQPLCSPSLVEPSSYFMFKPAHEGTWDDRTFTGASADAYMAFALDEPQFVYAVRIIFSYQSAPNPTTCKFLWRHSGTSDFSSDDRQSTWQQITSQQPCTRTVLVRDVIDEIRIYPCAGKSVFRLEQLSMLIEDDGLSTVVGAFERLDDQVIAGYAWDSSRIDHAVGVDIKDGDNHLATVTASQFREDLRYAGMGSGCHAFTIPTPAALKDGREHRVRVLISGTQRHLSGSPKRFVCTMQ